MRIGAGLDPEIAVPRSQLLVHAVTVTSEASETNSANNRTTWTAEVGESRTEPATEVPASADLAVQANGPSVIRAGEPFTYIYTITNQGVLEATRVRFEDAVPSDLDLVAYTPGTPQCEQRGDTLTCTVGDPGSGEAISFTLVITGHGEQPINMEVDPLMPGWPTCLVVKERTWQHVVQCELGVLKQHQVTRVELVFMAIGEAARTTTNAVSVSAREPDLDTLNNTITATIAVQTAADREE
jgi:uncharacterized repeat protein (TIGR01451 family)